MNKNPKANQSVSVAAGNTAGIYPLDWKMSQRNLPHMQIPAVWGGGAHSQPNCRAEFCGELGKYRPCSAVHYHMGVAWQACLHMTAASLWETWERKKAVYQRRKWSNSTFHIQIFTPKAEQKQTPAGQRRAFCWVFTTAWDSDKTSEIKSYHETVASWPTELQIKAEIYVVLFFSLFVHFWQQKKSLDFSLHMNFNQKDLFCFSSSLHMHYCREKY